MKKQRFIIISLLIFGTQHTHLASGIPPDNNKSQSAPPPQSILAKIAAIPEIIADKTLTITSVGAVLGSTVGCVLFARQWGRLAQILMNRRTSRTLGVASALMTLYALRKSYKNYKENRDVYLMSTGLFAGFAYGFLVPFTIPTRVLQVIRTETRPTAQPLPPGQTPNYLPETDHPS